MAANPTGFLVQKLDDGFGDVYPLLPGQRHTVGRAPDNRVVLRDDLCSRYHAEVLEDAGGWAVRDLGSLNGSAVNDERLKRDARPAPAGRGAVRPLAHAVRPDAGPAPRPAARPGQAARPRRGAGDHPSGSARPSTSPSRRPRRRR